MILTFLHHTSSPLRGLHPQATDGDTPVSLSPLSWPRRTEHRNCEALVSGSGVATMPSVANPTSRLVIRSIKGGSHVTPVQPPAIRHVGIRPMKGAAIEKPTALSSYRLREQMTNGFKATAGVPTNLGLPLVNNRLAPVRPVRTFALWNGGHLLNRYEVDEGVVRIFIPRKRLNDEVVALIDADDLQLVASMPKRWYARTQRNTVRNMYPFTHNALHEVVYMHRLLVDCPKGWVVDHINHNPLDNRRCNLRVVTFRANLLNRSNVNPFNKTSSYPGVYWSSSHRKWRGQIGIGGRNKGLGSFDTEAEAIEVVAKARAEAILSETWRK